jgi:fructokinase
VSDDGRRIVTGSTAPVLHAAIEAGGTKFRVAVGHGTDIEDDTTIPTTTPDETIGATLDFLATHRGRLAACGIAAFGPLHLDPASDDYGTVGRTPKPGWTGADLLGRIRDGLGVPTEIDIDVGGAALGEWTWGAARGLDTFVYVTVGTGIGGGVFVDGTVHHGLGHPETGHVVVAQEPDDDYPGHCPYHGICLEGMAAGPAIADRWGAPGGDLVDRDEVWDLEARYLAQGMRTYTYMLAPRRILLGGGVMQTPGLLDRVRAHLGTTLAGYVTSEALDGDLGDYLVAPELGQDAGLYGAFALAQRAAHPAD